MHIDVMRMYNIDDNIVIIEQDNSAQVQKLEIIRNRQPRFVGTTETDLKSQRTPRFAGNQSKGPKEHAQLARLPSTQSMVYCCFSRIRKVLMAGDGGSFQTEKNNRKNENRHRCQTPTPTQL